MPILLVRLLADLSLNKAILKGCLRIAARMEFVSAQEAGLEGLPDDEVLEVAAQHRAILVTHDLRTMGKHFTARLLSGKSSPGVFLISQTVPTREAIEALILVWSASEADEWTDRIIHIPFNATQR